MAQAAAETAASLVTTCETNQKLERARRRRARAWGSRHRLARYGLPVMNTVRLGALAFSATCRATGASRLKIFCSYCSLQACCGLARRSVTMLPSKVTRCWAVYSPGGAASCRNFQPGVAACVSCRICRADVNGLTAAAWSIISHGAATSVSGNNVTRGLALTDREKSRNDIGKT